MNTLRFCPRDHDINTSVNEYHNAEVCNACEYYQPDHATNGIVCGFYIVKAKLQNEAQENKRKEKFINEIETLKQRIEEKDVLIKIARKDGQLGKAVMLLSQKIDLEKMLAKKELIKAKYYG